MAHLGVGGDKELDLANRLLHAENNCVLQHLKRWSIGQPLAHGPPFCPGQGSMGVIGGGN